MSQNWFECAPSPYDENKRPQSVEQADEFINHVGVDESLRGDVWRRFVNTRGRKKFISWAKNNWFFKNFSGNQLETLRAIYLN